MQITHCLVVTNTSQSLHISDSPFTKLEVEIKKLHSTQQ